MPRPAIRFYLHSVARLDGHRVLYVSVGLGDSRPVRLSTGYAVHPADFSPNAPYLLEGAADFHLLNAKLAALHSALVSAYRDLAQANRLYPAAFMPLLRQAEVAHGNRLDTAPPAGDAAASTSSHLPLAQQPLRAVLAAWQAGKRSRRTPAHRAQGRRGVAWAEKFDPGVTPAAIDERWVQRYTAFLVRHAPPDESIAQHLGLLHRLVAHTGLPAGHVKGGILRQTRKCYLTWEEVQQLHAWQPPADKPSLALQKDVFVVRCLSGLSQAAALARLRTPSEEAIRRLPITQPAPGDADLPHAVRAILAELAAKYQAWPADQPLPIVLRQQAHHLIGHLLRGAGIDAPYLQVRYKAVVKRQQHLPKWQAASSYTPHYTYAALLARLRVDPLTMHELLGYRDFTSTMAYVLLPPTSAEREAIG